MQPVRVDLEPPLRFVTLDTGRPNALTLEAVEALRQALSFDADAPVVVLRGRSDAFCAGLDNATLATGGEAREALLAAMGELLLEILESPTRVVAACEGHAVAAGAMLLLVSDIRLGSPGSYQVGFTEQRLGMPLPTLPAVLARQRLDRRWLHALTTLGETVGPEDAAAAGFLDALEPPSKLHERAAERARKLLALTESAYRGSVEAVWGDALFQIRADVERQIRRRDRSRTQ